jgi:NAD(P)H-dependent FMN reductase
MATTRPLHVLAISGSTRAGSLNAQLLHAAAAALPPKPVAVIGASTGLFGAAWAQAELRKILQTIGAKVVDRELALAQAHQQFDELGALLAADLYEHLDDLLDAASALCA